MLDVQPYLDKLEALRRQYGVWYSPRLILNSDGSGAVVLENTLQRTRIAVDFDEGDDIIAAIDRLTEKAQAEITA
jgi:hypothetical protein